MVATVATTTTQPTRRLHQGTRKGKLLRPRWTRTTTLINVAAILLLLLTGAGTSLRFLGSNRGSPSTYQLPAIVMLASPTASPTTAQIAVQPGANPQRTNQYDVSVGTPKSTSVPGALVSPDVTESGIIDQGTLYRVRIPAITTSGKTWAVEAVSLADGSTRTIFDDPKRDSIPQLVWGNQLLVVSSPVVGYASDSTLTAIDVTSGKTLWSTSLFAGRAGSLPVLAGDTVFIADGNGKVYGIDLTNHRIAWTTPIPSPGNPYPVMASDAGTLYAASGYYLSALDPASGATRWQIDLSDHLIGINAIAVAGGHIVVGGTQAIVRNAASTPAGSENMNADRVLAVSAQTHAVQWQFDMPDQISPVLIFTQGKVIIGHSAGGPFGDTTALDVDTGKVAWQVKGALPVFADKDQVISVTTELHAEGRTSPATPLASGGPPVFQKAPTTGSSITLLGIDPASGTTRWVLAENIGTGGPTAYLPFEGGMAISISDGRVLVLRD